MTRSLSSFALSASLLALWSCTDSVTTEDPELSQDDQAVTVVAKGVDYSFARPSPASLAAAGYEFAARYSSSESSKNLSHAEAQELIAQGLAIVVVFEDGATNALSGYDQGVADARTADAQASADGAPATRPIYFAIDFDAQPSQMSAIEAYFEGVASVIGKSRTGAYGGYDAIDKLFDDGRIMWGWQTYAWSDGAWDSRAQLRQVENGIDDDCCDLDEAVTADYGQWGRGTPVATSAVEFAFQANTTDLWTVGPGGTKNWALGMMPGTSPSVAALAGGGYEIAFQANTGDLWTVGDAGNKNWALGMMKGTSPSITGLASGGFQVAFEANTSDLWTVGTAGNRDWALGMMTGTSPSIAALASGGFEVAFQANTTDLWTVGDAGDRDWALGMQSASSPAIAGLTGGGFEVAFEANTSDLWTVGSAGDKNWALGMMTGTSPAICALTGGGFQVAFEANTTDLWTVGNAGNKDWALGMMRGTSPAISSLPNNQFEASFQANTTSLWRAGAAGTGALNLGMDAGSNPASGG